MTSVSEASESQKYKYYVSVTSISIPLLSLPKFFWYTLPVIWYAPKAPGNVHTDSTYQNGLHMTKTVWETKTHMRDFMLAKAHGAAMKQSRNVGTFTQIYGYESDTIPNWDEAISLLREKGKIHFDFRQKQSPFPWRNFVVAAVCVAIAYQCWKLFVQQTF